MHATDNMLSIVTSRFQNFWLQSDFIFKLTGLKKKQDKFIKTLNAMSNKVIEAKKLARYNNDGVCVTKTKGIKFKPLLDLLIELSEENIFTDKEMREEVDTAIITGFDTTSTVLNYIMIHLGTNPRVHEEIYKDECVILLHGVHRHLIWGKDNAQFRPERWLDPDMPVNPLTFAGFSMGKRYCLGKSFAMTSMKTTLVHVLKRFKISADDSNLQLRMDFILKPTSGYEICLEERV